MALNIAILMIWFITKVIQYLVMQVCCRLSYFIYLKIIINELLIPLNYFQDIINSLLKMFYR